MSEFLLILLLIAIISWLSWFIYNKYSDNRLLKNFRALQERYGLMLDISHKKGLLHYPSAKGNIKNYPVQLGTFIDSTGKKKKALTSVRLGCTNSTGLVFRIIKRNLQNKIKYGQNVLHIGDTEFDENFIVNSPDRERMLDLLNFSIKYKLLQTANIDFKGELTLDGNILTYAEQGLLIDRRDLLRIELMIHLLCEIADTLKNDDD